MFATGESDLVAVDDGNSTHLLDLAFIVSNETYLVSLSDIFKRVDEWAGTSPNSSLMVGKIYCIKTLLDEWA
jgi:hypothetical protein